MSGVGRKRQTSHSQAPTHLSAREGFPNFATLPKVPAQMPHHSSFFTLFSSFQERGPNKILTGTSTRIPRFICHKSTFLQTSYQEQRLRRLQERLNVPFDETRVDHQLLALFSAYKMFCHYTSHHQQQALKALWIAAYPDITLKGLISEQWKDMGWQGPNPSTDFRYCSANFYDPDPLYSSYALGMFLTTFSPYLIFLREKLFLATSMQTRICFGSQEYDFQSSDACDSHAYATILSSSLAMLGNVIHKYSLSPGSSVLNRGCGVLSLENLLFFARTYPASFHRLLFKQGGKRAAWEYPFAVAGINVTFMLIQMLDLYSAKPRSLPGVNFVKLLGEDEESFDVLYCIAFAMMDAQWLAMRASYMEFNVLPPSLSLSLYPFHFQELVISSNIGKSFRSQLRIPENEFEVLQVTRTQLERELSLEDLHHIHDLPAYNLLYQ
ncbi:hypothetical protein RJ639_046025 [Escallonia herrerae]|uniref:ELMO domain-containing protein n=1 Tax=Escallonia herrerae TaxID=1293975 RepID=A0AA88W8W8_9ASTE|nr:hypothetical protein RJ639_046025 [Escallonia herrerae]